MKTYFFALIFFPFLLAVSACGGKNFREGETAVKSQNFSLRGAPVTDEAERALLLQSLDELAELERAGSWIQGMAMTESGIRENAGDYAGAVAAAYKELSFAYGRGILQKHEIEQGLVNLLEVKSEDESVGLCAKALLAFERGKWAEASAMLEKLFNAQDEEPDSFANWMLLVCILEKNGASKGGEDRRASSAYRSIRARYWPFPEYWYRGARAFSGSIAAEFAENCINSAVQGPFADECRIILASHSGLRNEDGSSIKTKKEIELIISQSVNAGNPEMLDPLLPLISLPDNPYTVFAVGALRALAGVQKYRDYFNGKAAVNKGRLEERLSYICRG